MPALPWRSSAARRRPSTLLPFAGLVPSPPPGASSRPETWAATRWERLPVPRRRPRGPEAPGALFSEARRRGAAGGRGGGAAVPSHGAPGPAPLPARPRPPAWLAGSSCSTDAESSGEELLSRTRRGGAKAARREAAARRSCPRSPTGKPQPRWRSLAVAGLPGGAGPRLPLGGPGARQRAPRRGRRPPGSPLPGAHPVPSGLGSPARPRHLQRSRLGAMGLSGGHGACPAEGGKEACPLARSTRTAHGSGWAGVLSPTRRV